MKDPWNCAMISLYRKMTGGYRMYQSGQVLVYGPHGACRVLELQHQQQGGKTVTYLVLEPLGQTGSRYMVPTYNQVAMAKLRPLLTRRELEELPKNASAQQSEWVQDERQRKLLYRELIGGTDRVRLLGIMISVMRYKEIQASNGRKCHICDENFLRDAERVLCGEIGAVLDLEPAAARAWLYEKLQ